MANKGRSWTAMRPKNLEANFSADFTCCLVMWRIHGRRVRFRQIMLFFVNPSFSRALLWCLFFLFHLVLKSMMKGGFWFMIDMKCSHIISRRSKQLTGYHLQVGRSRQMIITWASVTEVSECMKWSQLTALQQCFVQIVPRIGKHVLKFKQTLSNIFFPFLKFRRNTSQIPKKFMWMWSQNISNRISLARSLVCTSRLTRLQSWWAPERMETDRI